MDASNERYRAFAREQEERSFAEICSQLRRNDSDSCPRQVDFSMLPSGYGHRLGQALRDNTHVEHLSLQLAKFYKASMSWLPVAETGGTEKEQAEDILHFIQTSPSLQHIELSFEAVSFEHGEQFHTFTDHSAWMLYAIAANNSIHTIVLKDLKLDVDWEPLTHLLQTTRSLQTLYLSCKGLYSGIELLIEDIKSKIGVAFASNTSLLHLTMDFERHWDEMQLLVTILSRLHVHPTLKTLVLDTRYQETIEHIEALSLYLQSAPPPILSHLTLNRVTLDREKMELLIHGLSRGQACLSSLSLYICRLDAEATQLFLQYMQTSVTAPMPPSNTTSQEGGTSTTDAAFAIADPNPRPIHAIRHLNITESGGMNQLFSPSLYRTQLSRPLSLPLALVDMFTVPALPAPPPPTQLPNTENVGTAVPTTNTITTIARQLQSLTLSHIGFWYDDGQLSASWLPFFDDVIPSLTHLKRLVIQGAYSNVLEPIKAQVGRALRRNGSLVNVQFLYNQNDNDDDADHIDDADRTDVAVTATRRGFLSRVAAYCERNRHFSPMSSDSSLCTMRGPSDMVGERQEQGNNEAVASHGETNQTATGTRPGLATTTHTNGVATLPQFQMVGQHAPRTAPSAVLIGLVATSLDAMGPDNGEDSSRSSCVAR